MLAPKLRFKEFNDEWKKERLNKISTINPKSDNLPNKFIYIDLESVQKGILLNKNIINKIHAPSRAQRTVKLNDILFQTVRPYQQNNYFVSEVCDIPYIASTGYALIRTNQDPYFIYTLMHRQDFLNKVLDMCTGTSFPAINSNDLGTIEIKIPLKKEQEKISELFSLLNKKIELQQRKIEVLKMYKRGLIHKIFDNNKNISNQYKISECINIFDRKTTKNNEFTILSSTKDGIKIQDDYFNRQTASVNNIGYKIIPRNYITYRSMSDTGDFYFNIQNIIDIGIVSPAYPVFNTIDTIDINYFTNYINFSSQFKNQILINKEGGTRFALSISKFSDLVIELPKYEIQLYYSRIISNTDKKIIVEENKLKSLNILKKSLLQQMFI